MTRFCKLVMVSLAQPFSQLLHHQYLLKCMCVKANFVYCSGYKAEYKQRSRGRTDGCATFYKQKKFSCYNSVPVDFFEDGCLVLDRPNVALLLLLEPFGNGRDGRQTQSSSTCICVANTHLLYNPGRGDVKLAQLMYLFAAIDEVAGMSAEPRPKHHPIILCGDLNLQPFSELYNFIIDGSLHFEGLPIKEMSGQQYDCGGRSLNSQYFLPPSVDITDFCQFFQVVEHRRNASRRSHQWRCYKESFCSGTAHHALDLASAYDNTRPQALTSWIGNESCGALVDYIFYSALDRSDGLASRRMVEGLTLSHVLELPTQEHVRQNGGLPNNRESSDHLMLMAWFILSTTG